MLSNKNNNNSQRKGGSQGSKHNRIVNYDQGGTLLFKAIEERQWKSILSRISMSPHEVSTYVYR